MAYEVIILCHLHMTLFYLLNIPKKVPIADREPQEKAVSFRRKIGRAHV